MSQRGTASVSGAYLEFQAAVLKALPRDIPVELALEWANNGEALARVLSDTLITSAYEQFYSVPVEVDKLHERIRRARTAPGPGHF